MHMDPEFKCLGKLIVGVDLNTTSARDHVPEIESQIQVVKEWIRAVHGSLTYYRMPSRMIIELGKYAVIMSNAFPPKIGISRTNSLCTIMMGNQLNFKKQCRCPFGSYV